MNLIYSNLKMDCNVCFDKSYYLAWFADCNHYMCLMCYHQFESKQCHTCRNDLINVFSVTNRVNNIVKIKTSECCHIASKINGHSISYYKNGTIIEYQAKNKLVAGFCLKKNDKYKSIQNCTNNKVDYFAEVLHNNGDLFQGYTKYGKKDGYGIINYHNGDYYEGHFKDGLKHGYGELYLFEGNVYKGYFEKGQKTGYCTFRWNDGEIYEGLIDNDIKCGWGVYYLKHTRYVDSKRRFSKYISEYYLFY